MNKPTITEGEWIPTIYSNQQVAVTTDEAGQVCEFKASHKITPDAQAISAVPEIIDALIESTRTLQEIKPYTSGKTRNKINKQIEMNKYSALQKAGVTEL